MCKEDSIALKVVNDFIDNENDFTFDDLQKKIIQEGGILRISPGYSVGKYIIKLEKEGIVQYNSNNEKFEVI
jgi:hypothetical protein